MTSLKVGSSRTVTVTIKGKMERKSAKGMYLDVQMLRDGMQYPETYPCWNMKTVEHLKPNDHTTLILHCDGVKSDRQDDGQLKSYWWSISNVADANVEPPEPIEATTHETTGASRPATYNEQNARGYDLGMAFNKAVDIAISQGWTMASHIRQLRDELLHEVILIPVAPPHWCYEHEIQNAKSTRTGIWGHLQEDNTPCTERQENNTAVEKFS